MRRGWTMGWAVLVLAMAGCDAPERAQTSASAAEPAPTLPAPVPEGLDAGGLRTRAEQALHAQRIHAPAGDSAVDYYLALRERSGDANGVGAALAELQPYVVIAAEQALAREDLEETRRLLALLVRMDASAPALPRLREGLRIAQQDADRAEGARIAAQVERPVEARATEPAPSPARTSAPAASNAPSPSAPIAGLVPVATLPIPAASVPVVPAPAPPKTTDAPAPALPRLLADAPPRYPQAAQNRRIEGSVLVAFTIQPDGSVSDARPLSAQPAGVFEEAALAAASRWRFEATGRRVATTRTLMFRLPQDSKG